VLAADGQDRAGLLGELDCAEASTAGEIVHGQASWKEARCVAGFAEFLGVLRFRRRAHHNAVVVEPTGRGLLGQAPLAPIWRRVTATIEVLRIRKGTLHVETRDDAPRVPHPAGAQ